ncbi:FAD-dependent oxidoreductase [Geminisphaera colitermitum]|uniref:FAD-dependent oxidoreductase n=1 Tax=Geminisphaera colitermitum TaxID=1148786 RepID=UPI000158CC38|nr:FAD-dependent oxidoreductase [Geminisphaera colitermitum]
MKSETAADAASFYNTVYDTVIFGAGCAGFAATLAAHRADKRVLLVDRHASPLAECSWSFATDTGESDDPLWREWLAHLDVHGAVRDGRIDGAITEIFASEWLRTRNIAVLYHAVPVAVGGGGGGGGIGTVTIGTKSGLHHLTAREWIDATDAGELATLLVLDWRTPQPESQVINITFRLGRDESLPACELVTPAELPAIARLQWEPGLWPGEQILRIELPGDFTHPRRAWLPALRTLRSTVPEADLKGAVVTHGSVVPFRKYLAQPASPNLPTNVRYLGGCGATLAEKFTYGAAAPGSAGILPACGAGETPADGAQRRPVAQASCLQSSFRGSAGILPTSQIAGETPAPLVAIAGLGTGGAVAAIAAARATPNARVLAFEAMPFPGGIGTGGGFHVYYFGAPGGLQEEINRRVRDIMPLFGSAGQVGGFHPEAKKIALDEMLAEAGVDVVYDAMLVSVETKNAVVESALFSTPSGPLRIRARGWVDATGDGDLAAMAGAAFRLGRRGDGLLHAYSQSSGRVSVKDGVARMQIPNYDAGYCNPTDELDLTRARLVGVSHYARARYTADDHPTYIAPLVGLRQSRHIRTDYELTLDDLISRRRFLDTVGCTGGHYDNHARDYEFESVEAAFWVWVCQQWYGRLACEIPWRLLLPRDLKNVTLACRAVGVSEEAHHSFRMQRDIQRIGEAAGAGCALAAQAGVACRDLPYEKLHPHLLTSGAVKLEPPSELAASFGSNVASPEFFENEQAITPSARISDRWLEELTTGPATVALWHLYRSGHDEETRTAVEKRLTSPDTTVSWRAAAILAMWGDARSEPRLWQAFRTREDAKARDITRPQQEWFYVPRWYAAVTLLKRCITPASLPLLEELASDTSLVLNLRSAVALACEALARRFALSDSERMQVTAILEKLSATLAPNAVRDPGHSTVFPELPAQQMAAKVREDYGWQLRHAVTRARRALGLDYIVKEQSISSSGWTVTSTLRAWESAPLKTPRVGVMSA